MAIPAGLHIGTDDGIVLTWNGTTVSNTLNHEANFGVPAGKDITCLVAQDRLFVGSRVSAELWSHDGATWDKIVDATAAGITEVHDVCIKDSFVYCLASASAGSPATAGTELWRWDFITAGAVPTAAFSTIATPFLGLCLNTYGSMLVCGGASTTALTAEVFYSSDNGASWLESYIPYKGSPKAGYVSSILEHSDGYLYAVLSLGTIPGSNMEIWRTTDMATWELVYANLLYLPSLRASASFGGELVVGIKKFGGGTNTAVAVYDGTSWSGVTVYAGSRDPQAFAYYTDDTVATPQLWLAADDDLFSYDGTTWALEDAGSTTGYLALAGSLVPSVTEPTWNFPPSGSGITTSTMFEVRGTGLTTDVRIYKDVVLDTTNWSIEYIYDELTGETGARFSRDTALASTMVKIDVYISDHSGAWKVVRNGYYGKSTETVSTSYIKKGESVKHSTDGLNYYVDRVSVSGAARTLLLRGSGVYSGTWVSTTAVSRTNFGAQLTGVDLGLGAPAAAPP